MITMLSIVVGVWALAQQLSRRYPRLVVIAQAIERWSGYVGKLAENRRVGKVSAVLALVFTVFAVVYPAWMLMWVTAIFGFLSVAGMVASDAALDWTERSLGSMVRSNQVRRHTQVIIAFTAILCVGAYLFPRLLHLLGLGAPSSALPLNRIEQLAVGIIFCCGIWLTFKAIRISLVDTAPRKDEKLAEFVIAILNTFLHHALALAALSWSALTYLQQLAPNTFMGPAGHSAGWLLLAGYVLEKLTITGSGFVEPGSNLGYLLDAIFSLLGYGMTVFGVASLFAMLQRVKPDSEN